MNKCKHYDEELYQADNGYTALIPVCEINGKDFNCDRCKESK